MSRYDIIIIMFIIIMFIIIMFIIIMFIIILAPRYQCQGREVQENGGKSSTTLDEIEWETSKFEELFD